MTAGDIYYRILRVFDETGMSKFHWKTVFTTGMGFFTDAYDLFIIGTVTAILAPSQWHLSTLRLSVLNATSLAASVIGVLAFGHKTIYGLGVILLMVGALIAAFLLLIVLQEIGLPSTMGLLAAVSLTGVVLRFFAGAEMKGRSIGIWEVAHEETAGVGLPAVIKADA